MRNIYLVFYINTCMYLVLFISSCGFKLISGMISFQPDGLSLVFLLWLLCEWCVFCFFVYLEMSILFSFLKNCFASYGNLGWQFAFITSVMSPIAFCPPQQSYWYSFGTWWVVFLLLPSKFSLSLHLSRVQLHFI